MPVSVPIFITEANSQDANLSVTAVHQKLKPAVTNTAATMIKMHITAAKTASRKAERKELGKKEPD